RRTERCTRPGRHYGPPGFRLLAAGPAGELGRPAPETRQDRHCIPRWLPPTRGTADGPTHLRRPPLCALQPGVTRRNPVRGCGDLPPRSLRAGGGRGSLPTMRPPGSDAPAPVRPRPRGTPPESETEADLHRPPTAPGPSPSRDGDDTDRAVWV